MSKLKINIPNYEDESLQMKYKFGDTSMVNPFSEKATPVFAYDYVSLNGTNFCFNQCKIRGGQYMSYFEKAKEISKIDISTLFTEKTNHIHTIDLNEKFFLIPKIKELLNIDKDKFIEPEKLPTLAQFEVETDPERGSPRVIFFLGSYGVFHILFFDLEHNTYRKNPES